MQMDHCFIGKCLADYVGGGLWQTSGSITIQSCGFDENVAGWGGGVAADTAEVLDSFFTLNIGLGALNVGGPSSSPNVIDRCRFDRNGSLTADTGALYLGGPGSLIADSLFRQNMSQEDASAIFLNASATISNCTIRENETQSDLPTSPGAAVVVYGGASSVNNSILWKNAVDTHSQVDDESAQAVLGSGSGNACSFFATTVQNWDQGLLSGDSACSGCPPAFVSCSVAPDRMDSQLTLSPPSGCLGCAGCSPCVSCIDTGQNLWITADRQYDLNRQQRIGSAVAGTTFHVVDRGCFELGRFDCYANCDGSTSVPVLNVNDFTCFLNAFAAGDTYANCDNSTSPPVLNVNDFTCFLNAFAAGCS
jgi:hypothetical protein